MTTFAKRLGVAVVSALAAWVLCVPQAQAQGGGFVLPGTAGTVNPNYQIAPGMSLNQWAYNTRTAGNAYAAVPPYAVGYNPYPSPVVSSPYASAATATMMSTPYASSANSYMPSNNGGYTPNSYGPSYYMTDPVNGYLRGSADLLNGQGRYLKDTQQAYLMQEQVRQAKVETRRRIWEEWQYERANTPSLQDERERSKALELRRALNDPPLTEVLSSKSLNELLDNLRKAKGKGPTVAIEEDVLKQVNVRPRASGGNIGLLKNVKDGAPLNWPVILQGAEYSEERRRLDKLAPEAVKVASVHGQVGAGELVAMAEDLKKMQDKLVENLNDLTPAQYVESKRYLNQLDDAVKALKDAKVSGFFTRDLASKGKTVEALVNYLSSNGLEFAPAVAGDEAAYMAIHHHLVNYSAALQASKE